MRLNLFLVIYLTAIYLTGQNDRPTDSFSGQMVISVDRPSFWALLTETIILFDGDSIVLSFLHSPNVHAESSWSWSIVIKATTFILRWTFLTVNNSLFSV